jgi:HTH-type transcriptional regulator/antitoxin HigA
MVASHGLWRDELLTLNVPHDDAEYERLVEVLDQLIDQIGEEEAHPLAPLMEASAR